MNQEIQIVRNQLIIRFMEILVPIMQGRNSARQIALWAESYADAALSVMHFEQKEVV